MTPRTGIAKRLRSFAALIARGSISNDDEEGASRTCKIYARTFASRTIRLHAAETFA